MWAGREREEFDKEAFTRSAQGDREGAKERWVARSRRYPCSHSSIPIGSVALIAPLLAGWLPLKLAYFWAMSSLVDRVGDRR